LGDDKVAQLPNCFTQDYYTLSRKSMILITGATGFLGHNLVPLLLEAGYTVRALVRPSSDVAFLQELGAELAYAQDITDETAVRQACQGCQHIIHAAGHFRFWGDFDEFYSTNFRGTTTVLEAAQAEGVERYIHISTIAVVGKTPEAELITEATRLHPCLR
jgi:dihydroflavonol-4-reductase